MNEHPDSTDDRTISHRLEQLGALAAETVTPTSADEILRRSGLANSESRGHARSHASQREAADSEPIDLDSARIHARGSLGSARAERRGFALAGATLLIVGALASWSLLAGTNSGGSQVVSQPGGSNETFAAASAAVSARATDDEGWQQLRHCESTEVYNIDTGNTFYGAYQFTGAAWQTMVDAFMLEGSVPGNPAHASPLAQDTLANELYLERGIKPWPICGKRIKGPMTNPMVPQWLRWQSHAVDLIVFLDPAVSDSDIAEVRDRLRSETGLADSAVEFVSQEEALDEFQDLFDGSPEIRESVVTRDMPPSFRVQAASWHVDVSEVERWPGVRTVVQAQAQPRTAVTVPRLDISVLTGDPSNTSVADLHDAVMAIAPTGWDAPSRADAMSSILPSTGPVMLMSSRADWDLQSLRPGDEIMLELDLDPGRSLTATVRAIVRDQARSYSIDQLAAIEDFNFGTIALIAVDPDDTSRRLVVSTNPGVSVFGN